MKKLPPYACVCTPRRGATLLAVLFSLVQAGCSEAEGTQSQVTDGTGGSSTEGSGGSASSTGGAAVGGGGGSEDEPVSENVIAVANVEQLRAALQNAQPGDLISLAPGVYQAPDAFSLQYAGASRSLYFYSETSGNAEAPITIASQDPNNKAELVGLGSSDSSYLLWLRGKNWIVEDLILRDGGKGLVLDEASHSVLRGVEVYNVGDEAIHLRSGTSNTLIEDCIIDGTGKNQPGFGEGIYIGSDNGQWDKYPPATDNNTVRGCTIRGTTAEALDIKEGTRGTIVENCEIYGGSVSGENSADSFIDLKGDSAQVRGCTFYKENNSILTRGVAIVEQPAGPTATNNWIYDNNFEMNDADGFMVYAYAGTGNFAWNNNRSPAGEEYKGNDPELTLADPR